MNPLPRQGRRRRTAGRGRWWVTAAGALAVAAASTTAAAAQPAAGQEADAAAGLGAELRARFAVTRLADGVRFFPRTPVEGVGVVELSGGLVAIDGNPVSGQELRERLGADADLVLRLSYLDAAARAALLWAPSADGDSAEGANAGEPGAAASSEAEPGATATQAEVEGAAVDAAAPDGGVLDAEAPTVAPDADAQAAAASEPAASAPDAAAPSAAGAPVPEAADVAPPVAPDPAPPERRRDRASASERRERPERRTVMSDVVRFFGRVAVADDERVSGDVVAFGGPVRVDGEVAGDVVLIGGPLQVNGYVDGDVVVVGGSARFGPEAEVRQSVTIVGGPVSRADGADIRRGINHVGFGGGFGRGFRGPDFRPYYVADLAGTVLRFLLLALLASLIVFVGRGPVERVAARCRQEPVKAGIVGFLAQVLLVPVLAAGIFLLVISIIGIPFLLLLPFVGLALFVVMLLGFTGVVHGVGAWVGERFGRVGPAPYLAVWGGMALLLVPAMASDAMRAAGNFFGFFAVLFALTGLLVEYLAWTAGFGAVILNRFGAAAAPPPSPAGGPPPYMPSTPPAALPPTALPPTEVAPLPPVTGSAPRSAPAAPPVRPPAASAAPAVRPPAASAAPPPTSISGASGVSGVSAAAGPGARPSFAPARTEVSPSAAAPPAPAPAPGAGGPVAGGAGAGGMDNAASGPPAAAGGAPTDRS